MPLISVIMPAYRVEEYLDQCLQSVVDQDLKDIEIIVIDNGSPDRCGKIIRKFAKKDARIKPIFIKNNVGYGGAVNAGLEIATGKYIAIVETDDYVEPDMLSSLYNAAERHGAKVAKGGFTKHFPDKTTIYCPPTCTFYQPEVVVEPACNNDIIYMESSIWTAIYDRQFLLDNGIKMLVSSGAAYQDVIFKFMVYSMLDSLVCINKTVYHYRVFSTNSSSKSTKYWDRHFVNYQVIKDWLEEKGKFQCYKHAYYIAMCADFVFHCNRLADAQRRMFCEHAKEVCDEAAKEGVDLFQPRFGDKSLEFYYYTKVIPLLETIVNNNTTKIEQRQNQAFTFAVFKIGLKNLLRKMNKFPPFHWLCNRVILTMRRPFFFKTLVDGMQEALPQPTSLKSLQNPKGLVELDAPTQNKKLLVIMPWYGENAVCNNINILAEGFQSLGYETHMLVYWGAYAPNVQNTTAWDRVFWKHADNWYFGRSDATKNMVDANRVDDWAADDLLESVIRLNNHYHYDICMANYLFFTSALKVLPQNVKKLIYTHDRFAGRNSNLKKAGFDDSSYWFSLASEEEEASALKRADMVLAIQEEDGAYFRRITNGEVKVLVVPFIPEADFISYKGLLNRNKLVVGYIASFNPPNVSAIKKVVKALQQTTDLELRIAGSITNGLEASFFGPNIMNMGMVDSLRDFYKQCDVMINPDVFYSGLKVKTVEAMAFGSALVCTSIASTCLPLEKDYHQLKDEKACAEFLKTLLSMNYQKRLAFVQSMRCESKNCYRAFKKKYPFDKLILEMSKQTHCEECAQ